MFGGVFGLVFGGVFGGVLGGVEGCQGCVRACALGGGVRRGGAGEG